MAGCTLSFILLEADFDFDWLREGFDGTSSGTTAISSVSDTSGAFDREEAFEEEDFDDLDFDDLIVCLRSCAASPSASLSSISVGSSVFLDFDDFDDFDNFDFDDLIVALLSRLDDDFGAERDSYPTSCSLGASLSSTSTSEAGSTIFRLDFDPEVALTVSRRFDEPLDDFDFDLEDCDRGSSTSTSISLPPSSIGSSGSLAETSFLLFPDGADFVVCLLSLDDLDFTGCEFSNSISLISTSLADGAGSASGCRAVRDDLEVAVFLLGFCVGRLGGSSSVSACTSITLSVALSISASTAFDLDLPFFVRGFFSATTGSFTSISEASSTMICDSAMLSKSASESTSAFFFPFVGLVVVRLRELVCEADASGSSVSSDKADCAALVVL